MAGERGPAQNIIRPQPGPQTVFLASSADIAIYGGAAGGGKSWALLMEPLRHATNKNFGAVFFRRTTVQVRNEGGLWDESEKLYPLVGAKPKEHVLEWEFPSGASVSFAHLEHDKTVLNWQGSQIPLICFDELTHFSAKQFWYMVSRNRSMSGVRPYIRATCNPDVESWVATFIAWWIDQETGLPIPERAGVLRWFVRIGDTIMWADRPEELAGHAAPDENGDLKSIPPKSVTFVPAKLSDNKALMAADPSYIANLMALPMVERERLLGGNWKIRPSGGMFKRAWFEGKFINAAPRGTHWVRHWDLAATASEDAAKTAGVKIGLTPGGEFVVGHVVTTQSEGNEVKRLIKSMAETDGKSVHISLPQDPGQAGKVQASDFISMLAGWVVKAEPETGDKVTRAAPFAAQCEAGNVLIVSGEWNEPYLDELCVFPGGKFKDQVDASSGAFGRLAQMPRPLVITDKVLAQSVRGPGGMRR